MKQWISICSKHTHPDAGCNMCMAGHYVDDRESLMESDLTKAEIKKLVRDEMKSELDKLEKVYLTKKDVKEMIRNTIVAQYKYLWEKSAFFINQI